MAEPDDVAANDQSGGTTAGRRLRAAREEQGLSIDEIAARTRIPTRHIENIEGSHWDKMPSQTYSVGFAKSYASAVGLDRDDIGIQVRAELEGYSPASKTSEVYEAADPKRVPPKSLMIISLLAIAAVLVVLIWMKNRSLNEPGSPAPVQTATVASPPPSATPQPAPQAPPVAASGPVVLTATDEVWIKVVDGGSILRQGALAAGGTYEVPASAKAPKLTTGRPEALRISVGNANAPAIGEPGKRVTGVSLVGADLMHAQSAASTPSAAPTSATAGATSTNTADTNAAAPE